LPRIAIDLHGVSIGAPPVATIEHVAVGTSLRGLFSRRIDDAELILSGGRLPAELAVGLLQGATGGVAASTDGLTVGSVRRLALHDVELAVGPRVVRVDLESSFEGDRLDIGRLGIRSDGTTLEVQGALTSISRREGRLAAVAERLDLDELAAVMSGLSSAAGATAGAPSLHLVVDVTAPQGELAGYRFESLSATATVNASQVRFQPLRFGIFEGEFDGQLLVAPPAAGPRLTLDGRVDGIEMTTLLQEAGGSTAMSGRLSGRLSATGIGVSPPDVFRTLTGTGDIAIVDGAIPGLEMVRELVLAFGRPSGVQPSGSGSAFTRLAGTFMLADQTLRSEDVTFASRDFDMVGDATVRLPAGAVEMRANVVLSEELTAQAGVDLRRYAQEDGRVVVPAVITGTLSEPRVAVDLAAAMNRALQNEVQRQLRGLIDRMRR
jgi:hypothetical protein